MKIRLILSLFMFCTITVLGQSKKMKAIDKYINQLIQQNEIPGLALGIINNGAVIYEKYYGVENLENFTKVSNNSKFRVYSTTKLFTNVAIFQLINQGKLSLDDDISMYLDSLPSNWKNIKVKNLISHSSGLPDFAKFNDQLTSNANLREIIAILANEKMEFETGYEYSYNQTNYFLLAMIIEKISNKKFETFIKENQFSDTNANFNFSSNAQEEIPHRVQKYYYDPELKKYSKDLYDLGTRSVAANGLAITLPTFLQWCISLEQDKFIDEETKNAMWTAFDYKNGFRGFGYGWEISNVNDHYSYGFSGGNISAVRVFPAKDLTIVLLFNGSNSQPIQYLAVNHIAGLIDETLMDPYLFLEELTSTENLIQKKKNKKQYGYRTEKDKIIFSYQLKKPLKTNQVKSLSIAGSFNNWDPENPLFQMVPKGDDSFELVLPKSLFENDKTYNFKFVIDKTGWLTAPRNALNMDESPDQNLILKVK